MTRPLPAQPRSGRDKQVAEILAAARAVGDVSTLQIGTRLSRGMLTGLISMGLHLLWSLLRAAPLPLQCALYFSAANVRAVVEAVESIQPDVVYLDTVRCSRLLPKLRISLAGRRVICDFDDLMSRRMAVASQMRRGVALGFLAEQLPARVGRWLERLAALVPRYEAWALACEEQRVAGQVDAIVFVSGVEADAFSNRLTPNQRPTICAIPPPFVLHRIVDSRSGPLARFVFIGTDGLLQNRLTIDWLLDLWREEEPLTPLYIYGRQTRQYQPIANVHIVGPVAAIEEVYQPGNVMIAPALVPGGVKTKVVEAIGYGTPIVGNGTLFEGVPGGGRMRSFSDPEIREVLRFPDKFLPDLYKSAAELQSTLNTEANRPAFQKSWQSVMGLI